MRETSHPRDVGIAIVGLKVIKLFCFHTTRDVPKLFECRKKNVNYGIELTIP